MCCVEYKKAGSSAIMTASTAMRFRIELDPFVFCYSIPQEEAPGNRILQEGAQDFTEGDVKANRLQQSDHFF